MLPLQTNAPLDVLQVVPLWFPDFLFDHVRQYGVPNLFSRRGRGITAGSHQTVLDIPRTMGLDLYCRNGG